MSEAMNYKLPPLPDECEAAFDTWWSALYPSIPAPTSGPYDIWAAAWSAAIEAQGVPDGYALVSKGALQMVVNVLQRDAANGMRVRGEIVEQLLASAPPAPQAEHCEWTNCPTRVGDKCCNEQASVVQQEPMLYVSEYELAQFKRVSDWMVATIRKLPGDGRVALYTHPAQQAKQQPLSADRDAQVAELERELEKEKQYVKEMTKDRDHWMTVAAERALLLDKNRKVNKPLSDYEFDDIG